MTDTRTCPPCTGDCNQGRLCPAQQEPCEKDPHGCWNVRCQLGGTCCRVPQPEHRPVSGAGCVWAVVCGVPLLVALVALVAAVWPA